MPGMAAKSVPGSSVPSARRRVGADAAVAVVGYVEGVVGHVEGVVGAGFLVVGAEIGHGAVGGADTDFAAL